MRWVTSGLCVVALLLAGCAPTPAPTPSFTAPPEPVDAKAWVDLVWSPAELPPLPIDVEAESIVAAAAGIDGFVAVGYDETVGIRDGAIWYSSDGSSWSSVGDAMVLADVELLDVVAVPNGYVALGIASGGALGDRFQSVFLRSADGRAWRRLPATPGTLGTFPSALASGSGGVLAVGNAADGGPAAWFSPDGDAFDRIALTGAAIDGLVAPEAVTDGFQALGIDVAVPTLLRSTDGASWTASAIETGPDLAADHLVVGRWGSVVQGESAPGCGPSAACAGRSIAWWSGDALTWGRLPGVGSPLVNGGSLVVPAGDHGLLAIDGASAWSSTTGWNWTALPEPGDGSITINDAVVDGGVIVVVGQEDREDGTSVGRILVGR